VKIAVSRLNASVDCSEYFVQVDRSGKTSRDNVQ